MFIFAPKKKPTKAPAKKPAVKVEEPKVEDAPVEATLKETELNTEAKTSKDKTSIEATGKFEVVEVSADKFRMFNEKGQAVSHVVSRGDKTDTNKPALAQLVRQSRRANALRKQRVIATPKGHEDQK